MFVGLWPLQAFQGSLGWVYERARAGCLLCWGRSLLCGVSTHTHAHTHVSPAVRGKPLGKTEHRMFLPHKNEVEKRGVEVGEGLLPFHTN